MERTRERHHRRHVESCSESPASRRARRANLASILEKRQPGSLKCNEPLEGRMTAQSIASVSKSPSATVAASTMRTQGDAIIQVQDLAKIFDPDIRAVDGISFAVRRGGTYSGGMRKRLDLAMALIPHPKVLFLDEPTTGLDPQNRAAVWEYIRGLNEQGMTIFLTTQYMEEADRLADRLCIIDHGHIMAEGTPASLKGSIGADVVTLSFKGNGVANPNAAAKAALARISGIREIQEVDGGIAIYAQDAPALVPQIVLALNDAHLDIAELTLTHPTLDDVFMKYTGRKMRAEEVTPQRRTPWGARRRRSM